MPPQTLVNPHTARVPASSAVQRPSAVAQVRLNAPPVYRPVTRQAAHQQKAPAVFSPVGSPAQAKMKPPGVYRPAVPAMRAKTTAPPVFRPQLLNQPSPGFAVTPKVIGPARIAAAPKPPLHQRAIPTGGGVVQNFRVLGSSKLLERMPVKRPWFGYPYAVVEFADFPAQALRRRSLPGEEFLTGPMKANIEYAETETMRLRVSDDNRMAIEDSDLENRQPKTFYAAAAVIDTANTQLQHVQSQFRLKRKTGSVRILTGWSGTETLYKVEPQYLGGGAKNKKNKNPNFAPQNCNEMAQQVTGMSAIGISGPGWANRAASQIAGFGNRPKNTTEDQLLPGRYVSMSYDYRVRSQRANHYAMPDVGDAYIIKTQGDGAPIPSRPGYSRVRDIESGEDRDLGWPYHFGGVVAQSGNDRVTLENYARGDDRQGNPDPRWYFQMYGGSRSQSFHEFHKAKRQYANPITVAVRNRRLTALPPTIDLEAEDLEKLRIAREAL